MFCSHTKKTQLLITMFKSDSLLMVVFLTVNTCSLFPWEHFPSLPSTSSDCTHLIFFPPCFHAYAGVCVYVHGCVWRSAQDCVDVLSNNNESLCCLRAPPHLIVARFAGSVYSLLPFCLSPRSVLRPPRMTFPHRPCACPGMCSKAWATSGHSLSTSATCLMTQRTSAWSGKRRASRRFLSKVYESLSLEESFFQQTELFFFSARFSEHCHLSVERADSSVPSSCLCLSSVYLNAFMPHSSMPLSVVCSLIFNGYVASEIFMLCFLSCIFASVPYGLFCCHIHESHWYVCFWRPLWLIFNWNINVLWYSVFFSFI